MAAIDKTNFSQEQTLIMAFWNFRKEFYHGEPKEDYWTLLVNKADSLSEYYKNEYLDGLILTCVDDIEKRYQAEKGEIPGRSVLDMVYQRLKKNEKNT